MGNYRTFSAEWRRRGWTAADAAMHVHGTQVRVDPVQIEPRRMPTHASDWSDAQYWRNRAFAAMGRHARKKQAPLGFDEQVRPKQKTERTRRPHVTAEQVKINEQASKSIENLLDGII